MKSVSKENHREVMWFLLCASGLLGGCSTLAGYKPDLPESCVWFKVPHSWVCIIPDEGTVVPEKETMNWESVPFTDDFLLEEPLTIEGLINLQYPSLGGRVMLADEKK